MAAAKKRKPTRRPAAPRSRAVKKPSAAELALRRGVIAIALAMSNAGLSPGRSGNVSTRWKDGMLITPTGMHYAELRPADVVFVAGDGTVPGKQRKPSSEWRFHLAAYGARPDLSAVVHTHSHSATALSCAGKSIPAFHYMVAVAGGKDIPIVPYATFGTDELARHVAGALAHRKACLMANHGSLAMGHSLEAALELAAEVETLATQYIKVLTLGAPIILPDDEMERVLARFATYGQNAQK